MRKLQLVLRLLALAGLLACAFAGIGQTPAEQLTFQVTTPTGAAIPNAQIGVTSAEPPQAILTTVNGRLVNRFGLQAQSLRTYGILRTDKNGQAKLSKAAFQNAVPADKIGVTVKAPGYQPVRQIVELKEENPVAITLTPMPAQPDKP